MHPHSMVPCVLAALSAAQGLSGVKSAEQLANTIHSSLNHLMRIRVSDCSRPGIEGKWQDNQDVLHNSTPGWNLNVTVTDDHMSS